MRITFIVICISLNRHCSWPPGSAETVWVPESYEPTYLWSGWSWSAHQISKYIFKYLCFCCCGKTLHLGCPIWWFQQEFKFWRTTSVFSLIQKKNWYHIIYFILSLKCFLYTKATKDLENFDKDRHEEFKRYEMMKEHDRQEHLKTLDEEDRRKEEEHYNELKKKHADHPKVNHPVCLTLHHFVRTSLWRFVDTYQV